MKQVDHDYADVGETRRSAHVRRERSTPSAQRFGIRACGRRQLPGNLDVDPSRRMPARGAADDATSEMVNTPAASESEIVEDRVDARVRRAPVRYVLVGPRVCLGGAEGRDPKPLPPPRIARLDEPKLSKRPQVTRHHKYP